MAEDTKEKGRIWEQKRDCPYCNTVRTGEDLGFVHNNDDGNPDWSICFPCVKKSFDKMLKKETKFTEIIEKCNYCETATDKFLLHTDNENNLIWFICFECIKRAFNKTLKGEK